MRITEDSPPVVSALDRPNSYIGTLPAWQRHFGQSNQRAGRNVERTRTGAWTQFGPNLVRAGFQETYRDLLTGAPAPTDSDSPACPAGR